MNHPKLDKAFDPIAFEKIGIELVKFLSKYLTASQNKELKVTKHINPNEEFEYWSNNYSMEAGGSSKPLELFSRILERSIHVHHPHYIGHQVATTAPLAALTNLFTGLLNNGMAVYEMGAAASAIERMVTEYICQKLGFKNGTGILTSGGTLANLTAMLTARSCVIEKDVWKEGHEEKYVVLVSEASHYCIDRALKIMGFGEKAIVKVKVDDRFKMDIDTLKWEYQKQIENGKKVMAIVASAPSTATGSFDDLSAIGEFCIKNKCWFHVDAAHGGAAIFSDKYKHLLKSIEKADSIVIDAHKMLLSPGIMTFLLFKNKTDSYTTFRQKAEYLWTDDDKEEWFNYGKRTFECTKEMMSVKFFIIQQVYGDRLFQEYLDHQFDLAKMFGNLIRNRENFELAGAPESNIVCFRFIDNQRNLNQLNSKIRQYLLDDGEFYIVQTTLNGQVYLRLTIMNHLTNEIILENLLDKIVNYAKQ